MRLMVVEWLELGYFATMALVALVRRRSAVPPRRAARFIVAGAGLVSLGIASSWLLPPRVASIVRDWLPAPLILCAYWLAGSVSSVPHLRLETWLRRLDERLLGERPAAPSGGWRRRLELASELAYVLCYPLPPLGLGVLYLARLRSHSDFYWCVVLAPSYVCYVVTALWPTRPPRLLGGPAARPRTGAARRFNLWVLGHAGIGINTFPSAHVTASFGVALALALLTPPLGAAALMLATAIAVATVVGRYHYLADAVLGSLLAGGAYALGLALLGPAAA